jgi:two-component system chemotaxis sensor kinase CheA
MADPTSWLERIDDLLTPLSRKTTTRANVERLRVQLLSVASLLEEPQHADATALAAHIRSIANDLTATRARTIIDDVTDRWEAVKTAVLVTSSAADAAPSTIDDELATLASDPEIARMFVAEALDHLGTIESVVLQLEGKPGDSKLLSDIFRPFHTIKGNAGALGVTTIQELAHTVENLLDLARAGNHPMGADEFDVVLKAVDLLTLMIQELPARVAGQPPADTAGRRETLIDAVEALIAAGCSPNVPVNPPPMRAADAPAAGDDGFKQRYEDQPQAQRRRWDDTQSTIIVDTRKLDNLIDMVGELVIAQSILAEDPALSRSTDERLSRRLAQLKRITSDLQRNAMSMRMVPIRQTFQKMARLVRDLSRKSRKPIELLLQGEETELDRRVVEDINDPLMHMIRNSVDHGIEPHDRRAAAGKQAQAVLRLSAFHQAGNIVLEIADDGAGLNTDRILAKAIERKLVPEGVQMAPADIHQLIFQPGVSTAEQVTEISGRGVGMDVVRRNIEALRGQIEIHTTRGQGTTFSIRLPLTLAIVDGILLGVGAERFVMPTFAVRESLRPSANQIHTVQGRPLMVQVRERLIPILHLAELFNVPGSRCSMTDCTVVVIEDNGRPVALLVDELLGKQEVVIKSLGDTFQNVRGVAGGAILGDGRIGLILDASGLVALHGKSALRSAA